MKHARTMPRRFVDTSARNRRARFVAERWRIARHGGVWRTQVLLPGDPRWDEQEMGAAWPWHASCRFLSVKHARHGWVYHADMCTIEQRLLERMESWIDAQVVRQATDAGIDPAALYSRSLAANSPSPAFAALGGVTWMGMHARLWQQLLDNPNAWPDVRAGCSRSFDCGSGVDLDFVVPVPGFDVRTVDWVVRQFMASGERVDGFTQPGVVNVAAVMGAIDRVRSCMVDMDAKSGKYTV